MVYGSVFLFEHEEKIQVNNTGKSPGSFKMFSFPTDTFKGCICNPASWFPKSFYFFFFFNFGKLKINFSFHCFLLFAGFFALFLVLLPFFIGGWW